MIGYGEVRTGLGLRKHLGQSHHLMQRLENENVMAVAGNMVKKLLMENRLEHEIRAKHFQHISDRATASSSRM